MARCAYCRADTELYDSGVPTCPKCSEQRAPMRKPPASDHKVRYALIEDLLDATVREKAAFDKFNAALDRFPTGLPHPDGSQRIHNASRELEAARKGLKKAHSRLSDFLDRGTIPEDLKQMRGD